ncbi:MAG: V-type ATP synthase subunit D [Rikenellaceae bacterium]
MAIKFQYNKTSQGEMTKQLKMREKALPTIKSKESALRLEVKKAKKEAEKYSQLQEEIFAKYDYMVALWGEFSTDFLAVKDVKLSAYKIAGVKLAQIDEVVFEEKDYDLFWSPVWIPSGIELLKEIVRVSLESELNNYKSSKLEYARKKTTQKVNLYEKVQIPGYKEAILKIKRFMEDEDNLSKSSQKIVKSRHNAQAEAANNSSKEDMIW